MKLRAYDFSLGLQTSREASGLDIPWYPVFDDVDTQGGTAKRRPGVYALGRIATVATCTDFASGSSHYVEVPYNANVWALGTEWTIEGLVNADSLAATRYILGRLNASPGITVRYESAGSGTLTVDIWDSGATQTTLTAAGIGGAGTLIAWQVTRKGATVTLRVNGSTADTDTMSASNVVRASTESVTLFANGAGPSDFFDGKGDFIRGFRYAKTDQSDGWMRLLLPHLPSVLFDYPMEIDANGTVVDRSSFGNHARAMNSVASGATALCHHHAPVQALGTTIDRDGKKRLYAVAQGRLYPNTTS